MLLIALLVSTMPGLHPRAGASDIVAFDALDAQTYDISRDSVVQLLCHEEQTGRYFLSRAVVLDAQPGSRPGFDILLGTRHALRGNNGPRTCQVRGVPESVGEIVDARTGPPHPEHLTEFSSDWAILRTRRRLPDETPRLRVLAAGPIDQGDVSLLVRPVDRAPCDVRQSPPAFSDPGLLIHGCRSRQGLSGTPLVVQIDGEPFVVAVHVGHTIPFGETQDSYGIARRLNGEFLTTLAEYLHEAGIP
ncbi:hypothetical protein [Maricaulis sp.]|uniref:hypothetical protein n=1 Tax=Maricaulis sp. TaxID=1486257 RepID=UPI001B08008A|nr:hypothetical protein [Maricaulis sp.]MBO6763882.1 hypothetical protein [Maricaulis sp.]